MDLISSVELLASLDHSAVVFDPKACLHTICKFSSCEACFAICPVEAIRPGNPPAFDSDPCVACLACLPACPSGAYQAEDAISAIINCLARLEVKKVELICRHNPHANASAPGADAAILVRGCLAGIGVGGYNALIALGVEVVMPRLDTCQKCAYGALRPVIESQVSAAQRSLAPWGLSAAIVLLDKGDELSAGSWRPVVDADNPPLSRRDFFRMVVNQGRLATARVLNREDNQKGLRRPSRERRRLIAALQHLPAPKAGALGAWLSELGFAELKVAEACTACGVCETVCPTGTLNFRKDEERFQLVYSPVYCIGCGLCLEVCGFDALEIDTAPACNTIFESKGEVVLREGPLARCEHCGAAMAARPGVKFCPLCEYRRANPLGSALPPGLRKRR